MIHENRDAFAERLKPEAMHAMITGAAAANQKLLIKLSTGVGKTYAIRKYIESGLWRSAFGVVVLAFYTRDQMAEIARELRAAGVSVAMYPEISTARCMPNDEIAEYVARGQDLVLRFEHCGSCPFRQSCRFNNRMKPETYGTSDVIIIPEQLLKLVPNVVERLSGKRTPLLVMDEVVSANERFMVHLTPEEIEGEIAVAHLLKLPEVADFLGKLGEAPFPEEVDLAKANFKMSVYGPEHFPGYRCRLRDAVAYTRAAVRWQERGTYAYQRLPVLPKGTVFMGAYLKPELLSFLFDIPAPLNPFEGEICKWRSKIRPVGGAKSGHPGGVAAAA